MAGSGPPPDWTTPGAYYDNYTGTWVNPAGNRYIPRSGASPSGRMFSTSPYFDERMQMPNYPTFDDFHQFMPTAMPPNWPDFATEFRAPQMNPPEWTSGMRRIPIQVVKHPVTMVPNTNAASSSDSQVPSQAPQPASSHSQHSVPTSSQPSATAYQHSPQANPMVNSGAHRTDGSSWREPHVHKRIPTEEQVLYQNSGTAPMFMQDAHVAKDSSSSASDTENYQSKTGKVHRIPISRQNETDPRPENRDFASLKPSVLDGTAIPLHYQSLPNRPIATARDLLGGNRMQPPPPAHSNPPCNESEVTTPTEVVPPTPMPPAPSKPTASESIDQALSQLEEIRTLIDAFSSSTKDKTYLYLEDRLDKLLLKFDEIDTGGDDAVRQKRKQAVQETLNTISLLEKKLTGAAAESEHNTSSAEEQCDTNNDNAVEQAKTAGTNDTTEDIVKSQGDGGTKQAVDQGDVKSEEDAKSEVSKPTTTEPVISQ